MFEYVDIVDYYAKLSKHDGWLDYVRDRVKELEQDQTGMFTGLSIAVAQRIKELNDVNHV
jgi:hypothetical protein